MPFKLALNLDGLDGFIGNLEISTGEKNQSACSEVRLEAFLHQMSYDDDMLGFRGRGWGRWAAHFMMWLSPKRSSIHQHRPCLLQDDFKQ